jgi:pSer/pThr/pTyr-binding forkhead associated (FHA) protein
VANCPNCGRQFRPGAKFCSVCGTQIPQLPQVVRPSARSASPHLSTPPTLVTVDGRSFALSARVVAIGRSSGCDVVLPDDTVSGRHAEISTDGAIYTVRDLGSRNGTWVNGQKVTAPCPLNAGDRVAFGQIICTFSVPGSGTRSLDEAQLTTTVGGQPAVTPAPWAGPAPLTAPPPDDLGVQLRTWDRPPQIEGKVVDVQGPVMEKKGNIGGKVAAAVGLALIAAPLAWIPFAIDRNEVPVRFLRIQDGHTGQQISVKMIGDPSGAVAVGDVVAVWGVQADGDLVMQAAYNYTTDAQIRLKV